MLKSVSIVLIFLPALLICSSCLAQCSQDITKSDLEWIVRNLDLIIEGQVIDVETKLVAPMSFHGHGSADPCMVITEVTIQISDLLAGEHEDNQIKIALEEGRRGELETLSADFSPMDVKIGDNIIVGIVPNTKGTGYNILRHRTAFFKVEDMNLTPYQEEYSVTAKEPIKIIRNKARARQLPEISKTADLICTGTVIRLIDPSSPRKEIQVKIDEIYKGYSKESIVTVDVIDVNRSFKRKNPGFQVFLFLNETRYGYKTVEGVNGYYVVDGDRLNRGFVQPFSHSFTELKRNVKAWKEIKQ